MPKATRRVRKQVRGNAEAWVSTLHYKNSMCRTCCGSVRGGVAVVGGNMA